MHIDEFVLHLEKAKPTGGGNYKACCPAHEDKSPSLAVTQAGNGHLLIHCYAGCGAVAVMDALGLSMNDLFNDDQIEQRLKGAAPWIPRHRKKARDSRDRNLGILAIAQADRKAGRQLSSADLGTELEAFKQIKKGS